MKVRYTVKALSCCSVLMLAIATSAHAQTAATPADDAQTGKNEGEIVVTALRRNESLQKAPASITAFSSQTIEDARIKDVSDFIAATPNVSIVESQSAGNSFITIRGISQVRNGQSPVAVVVDGVEQVSPRQFTSDLFDLQQIEVLRGPQGAIYGRNAIGGAIVITTKQPSNDYHLDLDLSAGNGGDYRAEAAVSGPIIKDKLLFLVAGSFHNFGGLLWNTYLDKTVDWMHDRNLRGELKAFLTNNLTAELRANYSQTNAIGDEYQYQSANFVPGTCLLDPANPFGGPAPNANAVNRTFCANNRGSNERTIADTSLKLENKSDWGTITNVLSWTSVREYLDGDQFPYTASTSASDGGLFGKYGIDGTQSQFEIDRSWQDDFRIASNPGNRFRWMVGAYYLHTDRFISTATGYDNGLGIVPIYYTPDYTNAINPTLSFLADNNHISNYAFYGDVSYHLTSTLEATADFRYDHIQQNQIVDPLSSGGVPAGCTTGSMEPCSRKASFGKAQPKFTLTYKPNRDLTLFADWGIGFRSGEFNQAGAAEAASLPGVFDLVKAESASTTEGGFKASLLDSHLHINGTVFYTSDSNPFYFVFVGAIGGQILVNIDKVDLYGGEIEVDYSPIKGLNLFGNYGYTHSRIATYNFTPADVGNWAPYIPRGSGSLGAQYRFPVSATLNVFTRAEMEYHGKQYWDPENDTARSSFELVNLRGGIQTADGRYSLTGFVNNLTDKAYNAEFVSGGFVQPAEPRTYGIELTAKF